jgi:DNA-binding CsgD family transcriptional regulator
MTELTPHSSRELAVSRGGLVSFPSNRAERSVRCRDQGSMPPGGSIQVARASSFAAAGTAPEPRSSAQTSPNALLVRAWRNLMELRIDDALSALSLYDAEISRGAASTGRSLEFVEVMRAALFVLKSRQAATVRAALGILERRVRSGGQSPALATALRIGYWKVRDLDRYYAVPRFSPAGPTHRGMHEVAAIMGSIFEAVVEAEQLRLAVAMRLARSAHECAVSRFGRRSPVTARAAVVLAELLYEEGNCTGLEPLIIESLTAMRTSGDHESATRGYRVLARLAARRGDTEFAFLVLKEAENLAAARGWTAMLAESAMLRTQLLLLEGRTREAALCAESIETLARDASSDDFPRAAHGVAHAQVLIATGDAPRGAMLLRELHSSSDKRDNYGTLRLSVQLANALLAGNDLAEGRAMIIQALQVGARAGVHQTFVDAGAHVAQLLSFLYHAVPRESRLPPELRPYIGSILAERTQQHARLLPIRVSRITESLSPREASVLRSMSCGLSNKRIAQELQIAPETVKSHVKGIFIKLAVQTRAHAVSTAGALGLL